MNSFNKTEAAVKWSNDVFVLLFIVTEMYSRSGFLMAFPFYQFSSIKLLFRWAETDNARSRYARCQSLYEVRKFIISDVQN